MFPGSSRKPVMESGNELGILHGWPSPIQLNVYDFDDYFHGDTDGDGVLDRLPPNSLAINLVNMTTPPKPLVDFDCGQLEDGLVARTKGLPLHQCYPLWSPLCPLPHRLPCRLYFHATTLRFLVRPVWCRFEGTSDTSHSERMT